MARLGQALAEHSAALERQGPRGWTGQAEPLESPKPAGTQFIHFWLLVLLLLLLLLLLWLLLLC